MFDLSSFVNVCPELDSVSWVIDKCLLFFSIRLLNSKRGATVMLQMLIGVLYLKLILNWLLTDLICQVVMLFYP